MKIGSQYIDAGASMLVINLGASILVINPFLFPPAATSSPEINQFNQRDQFNQFNQLN
jgi:hypothetical protein